MSFHIPGIPHNEQEIWHQRQNAIDKISERYRELSAQAKDKNLSELKRNVARRFKGIASRALGSVFFTDPKIYDGLLDLGMDPDQLISEVYKFQKNTMSNTVLLKGEHSHHEVPTGPIKGALKNASPRVAYEILNRLQDRGIITGDDYRRLYPYPELIHTKAHPFGTSPKSGTLKRAGLVLEEGDVKGLSPKETADMISRVADQNIEHNRAAWTGDENIAYQRSINEALHEAGYKGGNPYGMEERDLSDVRKARLTLKNLPNVVQEKLGKIVTPGNLAKGALAIGVPTAYDVLYNKGIAEVVEKTSGGKKDKSWLQIGKDYVVGAKDEFIQSLPTAAALYGAGSLAGGGSALATAAPVIPGIIATTATDSAMTGLYRGIDVTKEGEHWSKYQFFKSKEDIQKLNDAGVRSAQISEQKAAQRRNMEQKLKALEANKRLSEVNTDW